MTDATLMGRAFEPPILAPPWLRPAVIGVVVALHAAALATLPRLASKPPEPPREVIVDIQPEAAPPEAPAPPSEPAKEPEALAPPPAPPPPPQAEAPPPPEQQPTLPPPEPPPPIAEATPLEEPPPPAPAPLPETPPPPPAPVELAPEKPPPPPPRVEREPPKPAPKLAKPKPETARLKPRTEPSEKTASLETGRPETPARAPAPAASAASQSAYVSAMSAAIRSRLFYPPAARARGAKGVVGVAFTIGASGALTGFAITHSSGDEDLDAAARALVQSAHFPPPPGGSVHVATSFNYVPR